MRIVPAVPGVIETVLNPPPRSDLTACVTAADPLPVNAQVVLFEYTSWFGSIRLFTAVVLLSRVNVNPLPALFAHPPSVIADWSGSAPLPDRVIDPNSAWNPPANVFPLPWMVSVPVPTFTNEALAPPRTLPAAVV